MLDNYPPSTTLQIINQYLSHFLLKIAYSFSKNMATNDVIFSNEFFCILATYKKLIASLYQLAMKITTKTRLFSQMKILSFHPF